MSVECLLFDESEQTYYRIFYGAEDALLRGSTPKNMTHVEGAQINYSRDGGSLQVYTPDGYVINVPQRRFGGLDTQAKIAQCETRREQRQRLFNEMDDAEREFFGAPIAEEDDDMKGYYSLGDRFDAPNARLLTTILHIDGGETFV